MLKPETREGWVPRRQRYCATAVLEGRRALTRGLAPLYRDKTAARANAAVMDTRPR